ncbi:hypothetical protein MMC13_006666 [Lambiella insularis]|nr:hypothetical protein [Lambiella insularis]
MAGSAAGLAPSAIRPPTPPHSALDKVPSTNHNILYSRHLSRGMLDTPDESPSSSADSSSKSSSERPTKRVDFLSDNSNLLTRASKSIVAFGKDVRALPRSRDCKPSKSILKPYKDNLLSDPVSEPPEEAQRSFPRMLEDVVCALAGSSRGSRIDAYLTLNGCLKAYEDVPDPEAMVEKLPLLTDFVQRDLTIASAEKEILDTQLTIQVLKFVTILLWTPKLAEMLPDDFCIFVLDQSITFIGKSGSSKNLINHYMHLIAAQKFRHKIMTNDRANRLLNVLGEITSHVKGNGVVGQRLMIYRTLLTQASGLMAGRVNDWIDHLFSGMLSNIKEVRSRALAFGFDSSIALGTVIKVSRAVSQIFNRESLEGKKFSDVLMSRLEDMLASKEESLHVPQIWSVTVLFLRSHRNQIEHWEYMRAWLVIVQKCFNSSDNNVKFQAHQAWNRLIFAINPTVSTGSSMVKMLRQPVAAQLERKSADKHTKQAKQIALTSYCTLLYYALRPGSSHDSLDRFWDEYVATLLVKTESNFACQILTSLLGNTHPFVWTEYRVNEATPIKPEELPRLDPQWVRQRSEKVLKVLEPILQFKEWQSYQDGEPWPSQAWRAFTKGLGDAGSKEVKVSNQSMTAIANLMNSMERVLVPESVGPPAEQNTAVKYFGTLVTIAVDSLGTIPFSEKRLIRNASNSFEAAETPSSRVARVDGYLAAPIIHLINVLLLSGREADEHFERTMKGFIQIALRSATSRHAKLKTLRDIAHSATLQVKTVSKAASTLWQLISEAFATITAASRSDDGSTLSPQYPGQDYREMLKIIELETPNTAEMTLAWATIFERINVQVQQECGIGASILAVIEPSASFLYEQLAIRCTRATFQRASLLLEKTLWPESRKDLDRGQKALWGSSSMPMKPTSSSPFDKLYTLANDLLTVTYEDHETQVSSDDALSMLRSVYTFMKSCPSPFSTILVKRIQVGLSRWIGDTAGRLNGSDQISQALYSIVIQIWDVTAHLISSLPRFDTTVLSLVDVILSAGLSSRHKSILNKSIELWNSTFGQSEELQYPPILLRTVQRLRLVTEMQLPGLSAYSYQSSQVDSTPFNFIETPNGYQQELVHARQQSREPSEEVQNRTVASSNEITRVQKRSRHSYSDPASTPPPRRQHNQLTPRARLRHDNSQIHFAAIESSPSCSEALESQFLTTRQKEVNERQHQEAATMFPDIRSSPMPKPRDLTVGLPKLSLRFETALSNDHPMDEEVSPTLPPSNELSNAFLGSSPTPSSSAKRTSRSSYEDEPPSSPPIVRASTENDNGTTLTPQVSRNRVNEVATSYNTSHQPIVGGVNENTVILESQLDDKSLEGSRVHEISPREDPGRYANSHMVEGEISSDRDLPLAIPFISKICKTSRGEHARLKSPKELSDAHITIPSTEVNLNTDLPQAGNDHAIDGVGSKYHDVPVDPNDEVSAQIANDMERALSQAAESSKASSPSDIGEQSGNRKRKRGSLSPQPKVKRTAQSRIREGIQVLIEEQAPAIDEDEILDCIVVDSPAVSTTTRSSNSADIATPTSDACLQAQTSRITRSKRKGRPPRAARRAITDDDSEHSYSPSIRSHSRKSTFKQIPIINDTAQQTSPVVESSTSSSDQKRICNGINAVHAGNPQKDDGHLPPLSIMDQIVVQQLEPIEARRISGKSGRNDNELGCSLKHEALKKGVPSVSQPLAQSHELATSVQSRAARPGAATVDPLPEDTMDEIASGKGEEQSAAASILAKLRLILEEAKEAVLQHAEEREITTVWLDLGREIQSAERRSEA